MQAETFDEAMKGKPAGKWSDAQWYVACVVQRTAELELDSGDFRFTILPPNPEIKALFEQMVPPAAAAIFLFGGERDD